MADISNIVLGSDTTARYTLGVAQVQRQYVIWWARPFVQAAAGSLFEGFVLQESLAVISRPNHFTAPLTETLALSEALSTGSISVSYGSGGPPDVTAPVVNNFVPSTGTAITTSATIQFDVTDNIALKRVVVIAEYNNGTWETIHDGDNFSPKFSGSSTKTAITKGFRFVVVPSGGWPTNPVFRIIAGDTSRHETA